MSVFGKDFFIGKNYIRQYRLEKVGQFKWNVENRWFRLRNVSLINHLNIYLKMCISVLSQSSSKNWISIQEIFSVIRKYDHTVNIDYNTYMYLFIQIFSIESREYVNKKNKNIYCVILCFRL